MNSPSLIKLFVALTLYLKQNVIFRTEIFLTIFKPFKFINNENRKQILYSYFNGFDPGLDGLRYDQGHQGKLCREV
jgi:hypothetical protein